MSRGLSQLLLPGLLAGVLASVLTGLMPVQTKAAVTEGAIETPVIETPVIEDPVTEEPATEEPAIESEPSEEVPLEESEPSEAVQPRPYAPLRPRHTACPTDVTTLSNRLLRDIPSYTNRVLQRAVAVLPWSETDQMREAADELVREPYRPAHILIAGQQDLRPLDLNEYAYTTSAGAGGPLSQVFFTTLSRQYSGLSAIEVQEYHWLFLTQTTDGWRLAFMFSAIDRPEATPSPLPPRESSGSSVGQAVQLWLRDCRAGAVIE